MCANKRVTLGKNAKLLRMNALLSEINAKLSKNKRNTFANVTIGNKQII